MYASIWFHIHPVSPGCVVTSTNAAPKMHPPSQAQIIHLTPWQRFSIAYHLHWRDDPLIYTEHRLMCNVYHICMCKYSTQISKVISVSILVIRSAFALTLLSFTAYNWVVLTTIKIFDQQCITGFDEYYFLYQLHNKMK